MGQAGGEGIEEGEGVGGFGGAGLEEEFQHDPFPVVALQDELVFEEIDEGALVFPFA